MNSNITLIEDVRQVISHLENLQRSLDFGDINRNEVETQLNYAIGDLETIEKELEESG